MPSAFIASYGLYAKYGHIYSGETHLETNSAFFYTLQSEICATNLLYQQSTNSEHYVLNTLTNSKETKILQNFCIFRFLPLFLCFAITKTDHSKNTPDEVLGMRMRITPHWMRQSSPNSTHTCLRSSHTWSNRPQVSATSGS